jgi:uncharacterized membrane protein
MEPYVGALIVLSFLITLIITSVYMIDKTMRADNMDFNIEAEGAADSDEPETQSAPEAEASSVVEDEEEAEAEAEAEAEEEEEAEAEAEEEEEAETEEEAEPHIILTEDEKKVINRFFSHTIGELLKIRLENERRKVQ